MPPTQLAGQFTLQSGATRHRQQLLSFSAMLPEQLADSLLTPAPAGTGKDNPLRNKIPQHGDSDNGLKK